MRCQLDASHDGVVARVRFGDADAFQGRDHGLIVEHLRHSTSFPNDARTRHEKVVGTAFEQPGGKIGLGKANQLLGPEKKEGELVRCIPARVVLATQGNIEANRESCKILRAVRVAQVDNLVELEPQRGYQLQGAWQVQGAGVHVRPEEPVQVLVHSAGGERGSVGFHVEDHEQEPD